MKGLGIGVLLLLATSCRSQAPEPAPAPAPSVCSGSDCKGSEIACGAGGKQIEFLNGWDPIVLTAPGFTEGGLDCTWVIKAQYGQIIHMEAEEINMGDSCYSNKLKVYDQTSENGEGFLKNADPIKEAACNQNPFPPADREVVANGDVTVNFKMTDKDNTTKFTLKFSGRSTDGQCDNDVEADLCKNGPCGDGCTINLGGSKNSSKIDPDSGSWKGFNVGSGKLCKVTYVAPEGSQIAVNFLDIDMKGDGEGGEDCNADYVKLEDSEDTAHGVIGKAGIKFCGQHLPNYPAPSVFASGTNKLVVTYRSDASVRPRGRGFKADISLVNPAVSCGSKLTYQHMYGNEECARACATTPPVIPGPTPICEDVKTPFTVTVIDKDTKKPIPNAVVEIVSVDLPSEDFVEQTTTGDLGEKEAGKCTTQIPEGANYTIKVTHNDYEGKSTSVENPLQKFPCTGVLSTTIELEHNIACEGPYMASAIDKDSKELIPNADLSIKVTLDDQFCQRHREISGENASCTSYLVKPDVTMKSDGTFDGEFKSNGLYEVTVGKTNYTVVTKNFTIDCHYNNTENCSKCEGIFPVEIEKMTCDETLFVVVVTDEETEKPIAGAKVVITLGGQYMNKDGGSSPNKTELTTDDEGRLEINGMPKGDFDIKVSAEHYDEREAGKVVDCDLYHCEACLPVVSVKLPHTINPCPGTPFEVFVFDKDKPTGFNALNGAFLTITRTETNEKLMDNVEIQAKGRHSIKVTNNGTFEILATKPYYDSAKIVNAELCCDMSDLRCLECSLETEIGLKKIQCPSASLIIQVNDSFTGNPISGANVTVTLTGVPDEQTQYAVNPEAIRTDIGTVLSFITEDDGKAVTNVGEMSDYKVTVTHPDYEPMVINTTVDCPIDDCGHCQHLTNANPRRKPPVCDTESKFVIRIDYTNQKGTEVPLANADVTLELLDSDITHKPTAKTDEDGLLTAEIRYDGTYKLIAAKSGFLTANKEITVNLFETVKASDEFRQNQTCPNVTEVVVLKVNPRPSCPYDYTITVNDVEDSNKPLVGANVTIEFTEFLEDGEKRVITYDEITDRSGQVQLEMNANGNYTVTVLKEGYDKQVKQAETDCPMPSIYTHEGWEDCHACAPAMELNVTMPHCDVSMPVTVRNNRTGAIIPAATVKVTLVETRLGKTIKRTYANNQKIPDQATSDKGVAIFDITAIGLFDIEAIAPGYKGKEIKREVVECDPRHCDECYKAVTIWLEEDWCTNVEFILVVREAETNDALVNATVTVVHETRVANGGDMIFNGLVGVTGKLTVPIPSKGMYVIEVTKSGYKTQTIKHNVDLDKGKCDADGKITIPIVVPKVPCPGGVTVSLAWLEQPQDLDLYGYKVGQAAGNESRCLVYYCDGKDPCDCAKFLVDSKEGGLAGGETITYCCVPDQLKYTHMLYVDDFSSTNVNGEKSLATSGAKITLSGVDRVEIIPIDADKAAKSKARYWLAGCLVFNKDSWIFLNSDEFKEEKPHLIEPLYCNSLWVADQKTLKGKWTITVTVKDAVNTDNVLADAQVTAKTEDGDYEVEGTTDANGAVTLDVSVSGLYKISVVAAGYLKGYRSAFVANSVVANAQATVMVGLSPNLEEGSVRLILGWNKDPKDMDLHTLQVDKPSGRTCHTFWRNRNTCAASGVNLDVDNKKGGLNGLETITLSDVEKNNDNTYMIWVDDYGNGGSTLEHSGSQVTITDGKKTEVMHLPKFKATTPAGVQYWIVGCLAILGESYAFVPMNKFTEEEPSLDQENLCHNYFKNNPPKLEVPKTFCSDTSIRFTPYNILTNKPINVTGGSLERETGDGGWEVVGEIEQNKRLISQNGLYKANLTAGTAEGIAELQVNCNVQNCNNCLPKVGVSFLDKETTKDSVISLNWNGDFNLDLNIEEEEFIWSDGDFVNCKDEKCDFLYSVTDSRNGFTGGDAAIMKPVTKGNIYYMVYVDTAEARAQFKESAPSVTLYHNVKGGFKEYKVTLDKAEYEGERYWLVGCIAGDTGFFGVQDFFENRPTKELKMKYYCQKNDPNSG